MRPVTLTASTLVVSGWVSTVRPSGQGHPGANAGRAGRNRSMGLEPALVLGRPCDSPGCASSANP
jgi:hypothetical protein